MPMRYDIFTLWPPIRANCGSCDTLFLVHSIYYGNGGSSSNFSDVTNLLHSVVNVHPVYAPVGNPDILKHNLSSAGMIHNI
jgi:hypothetical protein